MSEKRCVKCKQLKSFTQFNFKNKPKNRRQARCKMCTRKDIMGAYYKNREYYLAYRARHNHEVLITRQRFVMKYFKDHPCVDCGIEDPIVLQFDHVRGKKLAPVSQLLFRNRNSLKTVLTEIRKCEVRCANCHTRKTAREFGYYRALTGYNLEDASK